MPQDDQVFKIACTPPDHEMGDDVGAILKDMGLIFQEFETLELENPHLMRKIDLLFINCPGPEPTWQSANNVRELVDRGGALYISCYARKWIDFIFPGYIEFHSEGEIQKNLHAKVVDWQLKEFLGGIDELLLQYNTHWHGIKKITGNREQIKEYLRGKRQGWFEEEPLLVSFPYGQGFVIFTTFHNSRQVNALEHRLLEYLVLKPLMSNISQQSHTIMQRGEFKPLREYIGALSVSEESKLYEFYNNEFAELKFVFNWEGKATTRIWVHDPSNSKVLEQNVRKSPYELEVPNAQPGVWKFKMKIVDAPLKKFPYLIHVGKKDVVERQIELDEQTVMGGTNPPNSTPTQQKELSQKKKQTSSGSMISNAERNSGVSFPSPYDMEQNSSNALERGIFSNKERSVSGKKQEEQNPVNLFDSPTQGIEKQETFLEECKNPELFEEKNTLSVHVEVLKPIRKDLGKFCFPIGEEIRIGKDFLTDILKQEMGVQPHLEDQNCSLSVLDKGSLLVKDLSDSQISANTFSGGGYELNEMTKNIPISFKFPVILQLGINHNILLGFYP